MWVRWSTRQNFPREYRRYSLFRLHLNRSSIPLGFAGCVWSGWISDGRSTVWDLNCLRSWLSRSLFQSFALYRRLREHRFHPFLIGEGCCIWLRTSIYLFSPPLPPSSLSLSLSHLLWMYTREPITTDKTHPGMYVKLRWGACAAFMCACMPIVKTGWPTKYRGGWSKRDYRRYPQIVTPPAGL